jgi:FkbM family methyltransferase
MINRYKTSAVLFAIFFVFSIISLSANDAADIKKPRVSIIASVYNGDAFIKGFLEDAIRQTLFSQSELILINADSPGNEEKIILEYVTAFPNIRYYKLDKNPGLYAVYNYAIGLARADIIANADIDDRRNPEFLELQVKYLENNPTIDLVYSEYLVTHNANETWENNHYKWFVTSPDYLPSLMNYCLPGPQPVWRKELHERYGLFDETFSYSGDWEFWCRAASKGAIFKKIEGFSGLHFFNPNGLRNKSNAKKAKKIGKEHQRIVKLYHANWTGFSQAKEEPTYTFYSKYGQDRYLFENFFKGKKSGVFVDIGAQDGITNSNTFFLEKELNWNGVCIEPEPKAFLLLKQMRTCQAINASVASNDGILEYINLATFKERFNGIEKMASLSNLEKIEEAVLNPGICADKKEVSIRRLDNILAENKIDQINYLSFNFSEGLLDLLQTVNFDAVNIDVISLRNEEKNLLLAHFLESQGFHYIITLGSDEIYINSNLAL